MTLTVWMAAAESAPLATTGGLGDVLRALPGALARRGARVRRLLPGYGRIDRAGFALEGEILAVPLGPARVPVRFRSRREPDGVVTTLVECDEMFARDGIYGPPGGEFDDNLRRYILLSRAVCEFAASAPDRPDLLHLHDWHTAPVPILLRAAPRIRHRPPTVLTVHNIGYQGRGGADEADWLSLDPENLARLMRPEILEDGGGINLLKAGLALADRLTAVSPTYAREIQTAELGFGLDPFARRRAADLVGILNGLDEAVWNPLTDRHIAAPYGPESLAGKEASRRALRSRFGLADDDRPIVGVVSRLVHQKGIDLVLGAAGRILAAGGTLVVLGSGDRDLETGLDRLRQEHPGRAGVLIGYDEPLSHLVVAGSDLLLVPSRYEPCGLTQMYALRYGTVPVVRRTGGLADTVVDEGHDNGRGTGFLFDHPTSDDLARAVARALDRRRGPAESWKSLQARGMRQDFSWDRAASAYLDLYRDVLETGRRTPPPL